MTKVCFIKISSANLAANQGNHKNTTIFPHNQFSQPQTQSQGQCRAEVLNRKQQDGDFIADFTWSLYGQKARVSIVAVKPCDIYCFPVKELKRRMKADSELQARVMHSTVAINNTLFNRYLDLHCKSPQPRPFVFY